MVHTDIIQYLSEIDTNVFLYFNGIHSPFWDYFMTSFTGKIIWVPMYHHPIHITKELPLESRSVLCSRYCTYHHLRRPDVQQYHPSGRGTPAPFQSGKSHCRYGIYRQQLSWRELRFPVVSCSQFIRSCHVRGLHVPQTLAKHFHYRMGPLQLLHTRISRGTLSG